MGKALLPITDDQTASLASLGELEEAARAFGFAELAEITGIPRTHFYRIFSEGANPSVASISKIAEALGWTISFQKKARQS